MHETPACFSNLESPAPGAPLARGRSTLRGWVVPKPGRHFVDVRARVAGREFPGVLGYPRADLAAHFQSDRPWLPAEFTIDVDFGTGPAEVQLEARDLAGQWHAFHSAAFVVAPGAAAPASAADDPVSAADFRRAACLGFQLGQAVPPPWPRMLRVGHAPFHGFIARPTALADGLYGRLEVLGWLFHDTQPVRRVFATTDLLTLQPLERGGEFAGVPERYPGHPFARASHFKGMVDYPGNLAPFVTLRIYAELADGSLHLVLASRCRPVATEELKLAWPPFAPLRFWRHWRDLRTRARADQVPMEPGPGLRRAFWSALGEYRVSAAPAARVNEPRTDPTGDPAGLRLLLVTHNLNREGAPLLFAEYAAHLQQAGAKVTVLAGQDGPLRDEFARRDIPVHVVVAPATPEALAQPLRLPAGELNGRDFDLVVANTLSAFWGVPLAHRAGRPSLLYIHESNRPAVFFQRTTPALLPAVHAALRQATAVSFNTPATRAYYAGLGSGRNFHLNPAWIDLAALDAFRAQHPRTALRAKLGLRDDELLVTNLGTVCERKGSHDFLRIIAWLARLDPARAARCRFALVGGRDTPYNRELAANLAALGRPGIEVIAETDRAFDWLGAADVFACTSYEESFPRVVLEAMALEVPVVSTNVHGIPFMLRNGEEAALVPPGDIAAFASALQRVLADLPAARAAAARARVRVAEFDAAVLLPRHARFTAGLARPPA